MHIHWLKALICLTFSHFALFLPSITSRAFRLDRYNRIAQYFNQATNASILQLSNATYPPPPPLLWNEIRYKVADAPVELHVSFLDPPIPKIYLDAFLTTVLRRIAPDVKGHPDDGIPGDRYLYHQSAITNAGILYADGQWTWQILSWTLQGLLAFVNEKGENRRAMQVWISVYDEYYASWIDWDGIMFLRYNGPPEV